MVFCLVSCLRHGLKDFLRNNDFQLFRYAPRRKISGWSVRNLSSHHRGNNKPVSFEYVCPFCSHAVEGYMKQGWKYCICEACGERSDFTVTISSPYGYFHGGGLDDGKELLGKGYFEWFKGLS